MQSTDSLYRSDRLSAFPKMTAGEALVIALADDPFFSMLIPLADEIIARRVAPIRRLRLQEQIASPTRLRDPEPCKFKWGPAACH